MPVTQARADATRQTLLKVTGEILASEGYAALNEDYLCAQSGVTRGALRYHFPAGRYDLLPAFASSVVERQVQRLEALGSLPPRERLYLVLMSMRDTPPSAPTVALLELWMACRGDSKLSALMTPIMDLALNQMLGASADPDDAEVLAMRIVVHGASMLSFSPDFSAERLKGALTWLLEKLPPPPALQAHLAALNKRRNE
ncbi:TetR/AcrR family transcriptional regulator [Uliginosibacterium sp. H3]|uniref:TetR/AcrR family transcriptional regulator n=1 Tax=Uliginosibacterium silvisoli TaxID=3114758 RepID=A0ABU6JZJ5_9RHOO|nr:TetR/AcrR family transcriptional regulator [Uliginosibacterium sp. H3]